MVERLEVINPFEIPGEASRYDKFRPRYHHLPFAMIRHFVGKDFGISIDVACGTGHSTAALLQISKSVVGCDQSESMLLEARKNTGIEFVKAAAEVLPFKDKSFDFMNISMAFHWVEQKKFLEEAERVLRPQGFLAVDNYGFTGEISLDPIKQKAHHDLFEQHLPSANRRSGYPSEDQISLSGFEFVQEFRYEHSVPMSADEFKNLIMTWSNFQVLSEEKKELTLREMTEVYEEIFADQKLELAFAGKSLLYRLKS